MAFRRVVMQPAITPAVAAIQEVRFAIQTTGWKTAVFWANVFAVTTTAATVNLRGASGLTMNDGIAAGTFWPSLATISISANILGVYQSPVLNNLPDYMRWSITNNSAAMSFEIIAYLWDT
jgi:hypothetical protein